MLHRVHGISTLRGKNLFPAKPAILRPSKHSQVAADAVTNRVLTINSSIRIDFILSDWKQIYRRVLDVDVLLSDHSQAVPQIPSLYIATAVR
jgi:hypothetical protein